MIKSNFHTHTNFCDGKNTPEELIERALNLGFNALGFCVHSFTDSSIDTIASKKDVKNYYLYLKKLQNEYKGKIDLFVGIEQDYYSPPIEHDFDFVIGGCHYLNKNGNWLFVDQSAQKLKNYLSEYYNNDFSLYAKDYYSVVKNLSQIKGLTFIAHFDLLTKFNEKLDIQLDDRYYQYAFDALDKLLELDLPFEINTGAIGRGYRTLPYPDAKILKRIYEKGGKIIINSDCHNKDKLDCSFSLAEDIAKSIGFTKHAVITKDGIKYIDF